MESKWCHYIIVEGDKHLKLLPPCILDIYTVHFPMFDLSQTWNFDFLKWIIFLKMLRRYNFYGGIRRPPTPPYPSKRFGPRATMILSTTRTPWYRPPSFVDDIRGWDKFYLNSRYGTRVGGAKLLKLVHITSFYAWFGQNYLNQSSLANFHVAMHDVNQVLSR